MDQHGYSQYTQRVNDPELTAEPAIDFNSSYVLRALHTLPRQESKTPWRVHQNYVKDLSMLRFGRVDDGTMEFKAAPSGRNADGVVAQHG
jgi:monooxygenase